MVVMDRFYRLTDTQHVPFLDVNTQMGHTGYIDYIQAEDMPYDIMRGEDISRRPFLAVKYHGKNDNTYVSVIFQRYSDMPGKIVHGTAYNNYTIFPEVIVKEERDSDTVRKLARGESVVRGGHQVWCKESRSKLKACLEEVVYKDLAVSILQFI